MHPSLGPEEPNPGNKSQSFVKRGILTKNKQLNNNILNHTGKGIFLMRKQIEKSIKTLVVIGMAFGGLAWADDEAGESRIQMQEVAPSELERGENVDEIITNRRLRADTGATSKYSISTSWSYSGATIKDPGNRTRPNITSASNTPTMASLSGSIAGKYSVSSTDALNAGFGLRMFMPFHENPTEDRVTPPGAEEDIARNDIYNPYLQYQKVYRMAGMQNVTRLTTTAYTTDFSRRNGYVAGLGFQHIMIKDLGASGASAGLLIGTEYNVFDKFDLASRTRSADYYIGFYPFFEYVINDTLNFRTISGVWVYDHYRSESRALTFSKNTIYQSVGLGISVTRDIYIYPNVQFIPEDLRDDRTNVAVSANINVF